MPEPVLTSALNVLYIAAALTVALMSLLWAYAVHERNAGVVDIGWTAGLVVVALLCALSEPAYSFRSWLIAGAVLVWGIRLGWHLKRRVIGKPEDARYLDLRRKWGTQADARFFLFFQVQAAIVLMMSVPFFVVWANGAPRISPLEWFGLLLSAAAIAGESVADRQLRRFRSLAGKSLTCREGLWRYSRHPNYFFEWLFWVAIAIYASASPLGYVAFLCPALMLFFLLRVTGIPPTEAQAVRTRGQDYIDYQRTTSAFFPWVPRR